MQHIETTLLQHSIRLRYADAIEAPEAREWLDLQIKLSTAKISEPEIQYLGELRIKALEYALQLIQGEIRRLKNAGDAVG